MKEYKSNKAKATLFVDVWGAATIFSCRQIGKVIILILSLEVRTSKKMTRRGYVRTRPHLFEP